MIKIYGGGPLAHASAEADPYISLTVRWGAESPPTVLNLYVRDPVQGYVELTINAASGDLTSLVVIDEPETTNRRLVDPRVLVRDQGVQLDRGLWGWKVTPDYVEPKHSGADIDQKMSMSIIEDAVAIWFSQDSIHKAYSCNSVAIGVSSGDELVGVSVTDPSLAECLRSNRTTEWLS